MAASKTWRRRGRQWNHPWQKVSTNVATNHKRQFLAGVFKGATTGYQLPSAATLDNAAFGNNVITDYRTFIHKTASASITAATLGGSSSGMV